MWGVRIAPSTLVIFFIFFVMPIIFLLLYLIHRTKNWIIKYCDKDDVNNEQEENFYNDPKEPDYQDDFVTSQGQHAPILTKLPIDFPYPIQVKIDDSAETFVDMMCDYTSETSLVSLSGVCKCVRCCCHCRCWKWEERKHHRGHMTIKNPKAAEGKSSRSGRGILSGDDDHHHHPEQSQQSFTSSSSLVSRFFFERPSFMSATDISKYLGKIIDTDTSHHM